MTMTTEARPAAPTRGEVPVGVGLVLAELLLAGLWYPWVVEHLVLRTSLPFTVLRLLIVAPEYLLLAVAVHLLGLTAGRRIGAIGLALLAGLVSWGVSAVVVHVASDTAEFLRHRELLLNLERASLVVVATLGALAWGVARRRGALWLLAVPIAPALHYWIQHSDWRVRLQTDLSLRGSELVGMCLAIVPLLLAILAGWALEQRQASRDTTG